MHAFMHAWHAHARFPACPTAPACGCLLNSQHTALHLRTPTGLPTVDGSADVEAFNSAFLGAYRATLRAQAADGTAVPDASADTEVLERFKHMRLCIEYLHTHRYLRKHHAAVAAAGVGAAGGEASDAAAHPDMLPPPLVARMEAFCALVVAGLAAVAEYNAPGASGGATAVE